MNIYVLDANPITAARFHNDRHVVKMIESYCQLLALAHQELDGRIPPAVSMHPMRHRAHVRHPCARWARSSAGAYRWLHALCGGLLVEHLARYGQPHTYEAKWEALWWQPAGDTLFNEPGYPLQPLCMPECYKYKVPTDPVSCYRRYYFDEKQDTAVWYDGGDPTKVPQWWREMMEADHAVS